MSSIAQVHKPLGVRAILAEHRLLTEAAQREHRSVSSFVLRAALQAAEAQAPPKQKRSREEIEAIVKAAQEEFQSANPTGRDILQELIDGRRRLVSEVVLDSSVILHFSNASRSSPQLSKSWRVM